MQLYFVLFSLHSLFQTRLIPLHLSPFLCRLFSRKTGNLRLGFLWVLTSFAPSSIIKSSFGAGHKGSPTAVILICQRMLSTLTHHHSRYLKRGNGKLKASGKSSAKPIPDPFPQPQSPLKDVFSSWVASTVILMSPTFSQRFPPTASSKDCSLSAKFPLPDVAIEVGRTRGESSFSREYPKKLTKRRQTR